MKLVMPVLGRSQVKPRVADIPSPRDLLYMGTRLRRFFGLFHREDEDDDGDDDDGGIKAPPPAASSGLGSVQGSNLVVPINDSGDCEDDDDDDECSTQSSSTARSTTNSSTSQTVTRTVPSPPPPPPAATTAISSLLSTSSPSLTQTASTTQSTSFTQTALPEQTPTPSLFPTTLTPATLSTQSTSQSFVATILNPRPTTATSSRNTAISTTTIGSRSDLSTPSAGSAGITSAGVDRTSQVGIIVGIVVGVVFAVIGMIFVVTRSPRRRTSRQIGSSPPSSPPFRSSRTLSEAPRSANGFFEDVEQVHMQQVRPPNPSQSIAHSSTIQSATIGTGEIFPATAIAMSAPSPGLSNNPFANNTIIHPDGTAKTIIKPMPYMKAKEVTIGSPAKQTSKVQTTDLFIEETAGEIFPGEWLDGINKELPPLVFDMVGPGEDGRAEKKQTSLLLEHKPGGRWSDPFTVAWRGSGEASEGGTRWKSALSWVKDQNGRLNDPREKGPLKKSRVSMA